MELNLKKQNATKHIKLKKVAELTNHNKPDTISILSVLNGQLNMF